MNSEIDENVMHLNNSKNESKPHIDLDKNMDVRLQSSKDDKAVESGQIESYSMDVDSSLEKYDCSQNNSGRNEETLLLILQTLNDMGLKNSYKCLEKESGLALVSDHLKKYRYHILHGEWLEAEDMLFVLGILDINIPNVLFRIREQRFLENLESGDLITALNIIRKDLSSLNVYHERIRVLSTCLLCTDSKSIHKLIKWQGMVKDSNGFIISRRKMYEVTLKFIPSANRISKSRLPKLLEYSMNYQINKCLYHNIPPGYKLSLKNDHACGLNNFPKVEYPMDNQHSDEVWCVSFNKTGKYMASGSKDCKICIYSFPEKNIFNILDGHSKAITSIKWSPLICEIDSDIMDDKERLLTAISSSEKNATNTIIENNLKVEGSCHLLSASVDGTVKLWNVITGDCICTVSKHSKEMNDVCWLPKGNGFVTCGRDKYIELFNLKGELLYSWDERANSIDILYFPEMVNKDIDKNKYDVNEYQDKNMEEGMEANGFFPFERLYSNYYNEDLNGIVLVAAIESNIKFYSLKTGKMILSKIKLSSSIMNLCITQISGPIVPSFANINDINTALYKLDNMKTDIVNNKIGNETGILLTAPAAENNFTNNSEFNKQVSIKENTYTQNDLTTYNMAVSTTNGLQLWSISMSGYKNNGEDKAEEINYSSSSSSTSSSSGLIDNLNIINLKGKSADNKRKKGIYNMINFTGYECSRFVLRPCFGGYQKSFLLIGSNNGEINIWNRLNGLSIGKIKAHKSVINAITWCPGSNMFISCSDDSKIKLWTTVKTKSKIKHRITNI